MSSDGKKKRANVLDTPSKEEKEGKLGKSNESLKTIPLLKVQDLDAEKTKEVKVDAEAFQIVFYMKHFRVTDIIVKVVDHTLIIDACHREHADEHGLVSRSMVRKQKLPLNVKLETLVSSFTSHGFLVIHAEWLDKKIEQKQK
ncbi:unnamed protein product [Larinioides sclopetarius]|uniref:SHSP domain-containing protein n=1 Tax=Larinioides sclopetarius TaxID=280406 RepID=A0AAV1ZK99_9ARAC